MYEICVYTALILLLVSGVDYVYRAWIGETNPVPATWILMETMMVLSFWTYWSSPQKSWTANIAITAGLVNVTIILIGVITTNIRRKTLKVSFDKVQKWCLVGGAGVVIFWMYTGQPLASYTLVQCVALIGYIGTVKRLLRAEKSSEPIFLWVAVLSASVCAIYPAWVKKDIFSWIYIARAIPSTILVIYLIARVKTKTR